MASMVLAMIRSASELKGSNNSCATIMKHSSLQILLLIAFYLINDILDT